MQKCRLQHDWAGRSSGSSSGASGSSRGSINSGSASGASSGGDSSVIEIPLDPDSSIEEIPDDSSVLEIPIDPDSSIEIIPQELSFLPSVTGNKVISQTPERIRIYVEDENNNLPSTSTGRRNGEGSPTRSSSRGRPVACLKRKKSKLKGGPAAKKQQKKYNIGNPKLLI